MLLSIAMIVKNEEWILEKNLKALTLLNNKIDYEIIIVDTGSEDNTINIARKYTNKIYKKQWNNNFSEMRNYSISKCSGKWILIIDADEILENYNELIEFLKSENSENYNSAVIQIKNLFSNKKEDYTIIQLLRLFRNKEELYYTGRIHEQPKVVQPTIITNIAVLHYGYSKESFKLMNYKYKRNLKLLLEELKENNKNEYTFFQLAQTYQMANINDKAFESINKAYNLIKNNKNQENYLYIYHLYVVILFLNSEYEKTIELSKKAINYKNDHLDFYYFIAKSYTILDKCEEANFYYDEYFKLHKKISDGYINNDISVSNMSFSKLKDMLKDKIVISFKNKDYKYILDNYVKCDGQDIEYIVIYTLLKKKRYKEIFNYYKSKKINDKKINNIILAFEKINKEELNNNILDIYINLLGLDENLDNYINYIYRDKTIDNIDFKEFYLYKSKIFNKYILEDKNQLEKIKELNKSDIYNYLFNLVNDYRGIEILYEYSKEYFLNSDINQLSFLIIIEDILIKNQNIENKDYKNLFYRTLINKINYIENIYDKEILNKYYKRICTKDEVFFIEVSNLLKIYSIDKYEYVKKIREFIKEYPEYKVLINYLKENIEISDIKYEIILKERENFISNIKMLIENNMIVEAEKVIKEIHEYFRYDSEINNLLGIINYFNRDYSNALIYFGLSSIFEKNNFDSVYNIALVLEELNRKNDSKFYYNKALELSDDNIIRSELIDKIY